MSPTWPRRAAVLSSMSATLRLVAVFTVAASERMPTALGLRVYSFYGMQSRAAFLATAMRWTFLARIATVFLQRLGRYDEQPQPKAKRNFFRADGPKVAAVPSVV